MSKIEEFWAERRDILTIGVVPQLGAENEPDPWWDVVLRIDGTYAMLGDALYAAGGMAHWMTESGHSLGRGIVPQYGYRVILTEDGVLLKRHHGKRAVYGWPPKISGIM